LNGIRHNTGEKQDRHTVAELELVMDQFQYIESTKRQVLLKALKDCEVTFGEGDYQLIHE
jgi:hypothetical protein